MSDHRVDWTRSDLTPEEVAQVWREAPMVSVDPESYDALLEALEQEPRVLPELKRSLWHHR